MAINPNTQLAPNVTPPDANYPYGSAKNETAPGNFDGTPYNKTRADDVFGLQQALLNAAGIVPSGTADTIVTSQYVQAISEIAAGRGYTFDDTGSANTYIVTKKANQHPPASLFDGFVVVFKPDNTNTGPSTLDVLGFGAKAIRYPGGAALTGGELVAGRFVGVRYDQLNDRFELQSSADANLLNGQPGSYYLAYANFTGVAALSAIPNLPASRTTSGTFDAARLPNASLTVKGAVKISGDFATTDPDTAAASALTNNLDANKAGRTTEETGHTRAGSLQKYDATGSSVGARTLTTDTAQGVWTSYGPAATGADISWSAMDDIPNEATMILLQIESRISASSGSQAFVETYAGENGPNLTGTLPDRLREAQALVEGVAGDESGNIVMAIVPLDGQRRFQATWDQDNASGQTVQLRYKGFITD